MKARSNKNLVRKANEGYYPRRRFRDTFIDGLKSVGSWVKKKLYASWLGMRRSCHNSAFLLPVLIGIAAFVLGVVCIFRIQFVKGTQFDQFGGRAWAGSDSGVAQMTLVTRWQPQRFGSLPALLDSEKSFTVSEIERLHESIERLLQEGQKANDKNRPNSGSSNEQIKLWLDAYSTEVSATLGRTDRDDINPVTAALVGVGGDYDRVHRLQMLSGSFFNPYDLNTRQIVLDENLAFQLFSTNDVVGFTVDMSGTEYTITGVCARIASREAEETYGVLPRGYIPFVELKNAVYVGFDQQTEPEIAVMYYEAIMPSPLDGLANEQFNQAIEETGKSRASFLVFENSGRFTLSRLWNSVFPVGMKTFAAADYQLPFYEHSARVAEGRIFYWWVLLFVCIFAAMFSLLSLYGRFASKRKLVKKEKVTVEADFDIMELR